MTKLKFVLYLIGAIQIVLGLFHLFAPAFFLANTGHTLPEADIHYPLAMLASRFLVVGVVFIYIARDPAKYVLWIKAMVAFQFIDLAAGVFFTATGVVSLADSAFPMFNATWMMLLLLLWMPKEKEQSTY